MTASDLDAELAALDTIALSELRRTWIRLNKAAPPIGAILLLGALVVLRLLSRHAQPAPKFIRKRLLTEAEAAVLGLLETALPDHRIMVQVAMGALLDAGESDRKRAHATRNRFAQKIVDYVVVTRDTAEVVALVELDDRTHRAERDRKRDSMTAAAGYQTIRISGRPKPTLESVRSAVASLGVSGNGSRTQLGVVKR